MAYQPPFGGLSASVALAIRAGKWIGGFLVAAGAAMLALAWRKRTRTR
jgi:hypothetical protein